MTVCVNCNIEVPEGEFCPECGALCKTITPEQGVKSLGALKVGSQLLGKYIVEQVLQSGTINQYLASLNAGKVIIKEMCLATPVASAGPGAGPPETGESLPGLVSREPVSGLKQEYDLLQLLGPEVAVKALEYIVDGDHEYLILESYLGSRLSEVLPQDGFPRLMAVKTVIGLCQALEKMHRLGYIHLDITPDHILLKDGRVKLLLSRRNQKLGTPGENYLTTDGYSAPQLYASGPVTLDERADVFSLGAVLYTCLTGKVLPPGQISAALLNNTGEPEIVRVLRGCLTNNVEIRFRTVTEAKDRLSTYLLKAESDFYFDQAIISDIGMVRQNNEDCGIILGASNWRESQVDSWGLYLVADGMGGEQAGEVASSKAVTEISNFIWEHMRQASVTDYNELVKQAIGVANKEIYLLARKNPAQSTMGTTVTLGLRKGRELYIGHVGDSRAYLIRDGAIRQLTDDHSLVAGQVKAGLITPEEAKTHPNRNQIYRSLGNAPTVVVDVLKEGCLSLRPGDALLFCTDGLTGQVDDSEILASVIGSENAGNTCSRLVRLVNTRGGDDNVTVIIIKVTDHN